jgi:hypothetical protein
MADLLIEEFRSVWPRREGCARLADGFSSVASMKRLLPLLLVACAASAKSASLRDQAARDLACPVADLKVTQESPGLAEVEGCGRKATYHQGCNEYNTSAGCRWYKY